MLIITSLVIEEIQDLMIARDFPNMKLLFVNLEYLETTANGDAIIGVSPVVGNEANSTPPPAGYIWKYNNVNIIGQLYPMDSLYINLDDDIPLNNYQDRLIFYYNS